MKYFSYLLLIGSAAAQCASQEKVDAGNATAIKA
jgi:hypothetical protein